MTRNPLRGDARAAGVGAPYPAPRNPVSTLSRRDRGARRVRSSSATGWCRRPAARPASDSRRSGPQPEPRKCVTSDRRSRSRRAVQRPFHCFQRGDDHVGRAASPRSTCSQNSSARVHSAEHPSGFAPPAVPAPRSAARSGTRAARPGLRRTATSISRRQGIPAPGSRSRPESRDTADPRLRKETDRHLPLPWRWA